MYSVNKNNICPFIIFVLLSLPLFVRPQEGKPGSKNNRPCIYVNSASRDDFIKSAGETQWAKDIIEGKKQNLEKYLKLCDSEPEWLLSRLQMNWKTKHDKVYLRGDFFSCSEGEAPVPTVRFAGQRDWSTDYLQPSLEEIEPYFDDERGMYLKNNKTKEMEWAHPSKTGHIIENINAKIMALGRIFTVMDFLF